MIYEKAYAKINLALAVQDEKDGYHEVENIMIPISLYDELFFEKAKEVEVHCELDIEDNLCLKAAHLLLDKYHIKEGVSITLNKNIPLMAGLAGGSSDAAATLRGLNRLYELHASKEELTELAIQLGSDVPFFLEHQIAMCTHRGEIVTPLNLDFRDVPVLIIKPNYGLSTKEVYQHYVYKEYSSKEKINTLMNAIQLKDVDLVDQAIFNDLEAVALSLNSELKALFEAIAGLSYIPHISGSGPSIFLLNARMQELENIKKIDDQLNLLLCHTL